VRISVICKLILLPFSISVTEIIHCKLISKTNYKHFSYLTIITGEQVQFSALCYIMISSSSCVVSTIATVLLLQLSGPCNIVLQGVHNCICTSTMGRN